MNKTFAAVVCGTILGLGLVQASAAAAASFAALILWSLFESSKWQVGTGLLVAKLHKAV